MEKRFPILKDLRTHLELSQKYILATAILHNIATLWNKDLPDGDDGDICIPQDVGDRDPDVRVDMHSVTP